jgi:propanol-preferring alcohol dehydrogenase
MLAPSMRALVLETFGGPFVPKDVPTPVIAPHEALVRVRNVGVCGTDVKIRANRMGLGVIPLIMGHEIAGEVAEVGSLVRGFAPGDRVVVNFYVTCGRCPFCRAGRDTLCAEVRQHGFSIDGGFAEYIKTPGVNLCRVPDRVSLESACILGDAVATSYHAITKRAQVRPGTTVALVGVGGVGLHALQMARLAGSWVVAVDVNEARLELARALGADAVVDARSGPFHEAVRKLTDGQGVDVVLEFVANPQTLPSSIQSLRRAGRLVFVGYTPEVPMSVLPRELVRSELEIVGSRANTKQELQETMDLVAGGRITPIIDRVIPLESIEDAFAALRDGTPLGRNVLAI